MATWVCCVFGESGPRSKGHSIHREAGGASQTRVVSGRVGEALEGAQDVDRQCPPVVAAACAAADVAGICSPGQAGGNSVRRAFARRESAATATLDVREGTRLLSASTPSNQGAPDVDRRCPPVVATACAAADVAEICSPGQAGGNSVRRAFARRESAATATLSLRGSLRG